MTATSQGATAAGDAATSARQRRVDAFAGEVIDKMLATIVEHKMTYAEYDAVKQWLIRVGEAKEWPLFLDVWFEHTVERLAGEDRQDSTGAILGPYYLPDAPALPSPAVLPRRPDEPGQVLVLRGAVRGLDGTPLAGAMLDIWQSDSDGNYSGFAPGIPAGNLRARVVADDQGRYEIRTVIPGPYMIPTDGPCGELVAAAAWSPWRPAHLHLIVGAAGHEQITTQLFFAGDPYLENDVASAVKPELVLAPVEESDATGRHLAVGYDFELAATP